MSADQRPGFWGFLRFAVKNASVFKAYQRRDALRVKLALLNIRIAAMDTLEAPYALRVREFDEAMLHHYSGKWFATRGLETGDKATFRRAFEAFDRGQRIAQRITERLDSGSAEPAVDAFTPLEARGTEILFAGEVPLVPAITPVVVLQGTDVEMGRQYVRQIAAIFGPWILERCRRSFTEDERAELRRWEAVHAEHTPEILDFARGWAEGAAQAGVPLSEDEVLDLWLGHKPPADSYLNAERGLPELPPLACSSLAAWGRATPDGHMVAVATGDHDLSYQVTVMAWPERGQPFVHTLFGAIGTLPTVGPNWFFGHPGMNRAGLAYVHHGGGPKMLEPRSTWGYGLRRTASVWHILRFADTHDQARAMEEGWPIGDVGNGDQATVGGFYADDTGGYVIESRQSPVAIREAGVLGERDFLYANNSVSHPAAVESEWMRVRPESWQWDEEGGYRPRAPKGMTKSLGLIYKWATGGMSMDDMLVQGLQFAYWNSYNRNVFLRRMAERHHGALDVETLRAVYRTFGLLPRGRWAEAKKRYKQTGAWGPISAAHASNAFVAVMKPSEGLYSLCTGPAARGAPPMSPDFAISIRGETNAFWDVRLTDSPAETLAAAQALARELVAQADEALEGDGLPEWRGWLAEAREALRETGDVGRQLRAATRAQVRARQVLQALNPPRLLDYPEAPGRQGASAGVAAS